MTRKDAARELLAWMAGQRQLLGFHEQDSGELDLGEGVARPIFANIYPHQAAVTALLELTRQRAHAWQRLSERERMLGRVELIDVLSGLEVPGEPIALPQVSPERHAGAEALEVLLRKRHAWLF